MLGGDKRHLLFLIAPSCVLAACTDSPLTDSARLAITVAPLTLPGVSDACYSLAINNEAGDSVTTRQHICASQFGAHGSIAYVAPCDATDPDADGTAAHTVTLTIDGLYGPGGPSNPLTDWLNPCAAPYAPAGCQLTAACVANADTPVAFDLTVMRRAHQGFFDISVTFDDLFCSAKLDCGATTAPADDLNLLHNPDGDRDLTAVLALACTGGTSADTHLYMSNVHISCVGQPQDTVVSVATPGLVDLTAAPSQNPNNYLYAAQVTQGDEALAHKRYWTVALGLNAANFPAGVCTLTTSATASDGPLSGLTPPETTTAYPIIRWDVPLSAANARTCTTHPLNGTPTGVATDYVTGSPPVQFDHGVSREAQCATSTDCIPGPCATASCDAGVCRYDACAQLGQQCVDGVCAGLGTLEFPGESCSALVAGGVTTDGTYFIDPDGPGGAAPFSVQCDMTTDGGGWMLAYDDMGTPQIKQTIDPNVNNLLITQLLAYDANGTPSVVALASGLSSLAAAFAQSWTFANFENDYYRPLGADSGNHMTTLYIFDDGDIAGGNQVSCSGRQSDFATPPHGLIAYGFTASITFADAGTCEYGHYGPLSIRKLLVR